MKNLLLMLVLCFVSCNSEQKENVNDGEKTSNQLFAELLQKSNDTAITNYNISFENDVTNLKKVEESLLNTLISNYDFFINNKKTTFQETIGNHMYILDFKDLKDFAFISAITKGEDHQSLYFLTLSKENRRANIYNIGMAGYDEFQFISNIAGKKVDDNTFNFSTMNTNYEFPDGIEGGKEYITETDSISFKINVLDNGEFKKTPIDSIRTTKNVRMEKPSNN